LLEAQRNFGGDKRFFIEDEFAGKRYGAFDAVVSFDLIERISPELEGQFFATVRANLGDDGVCVIGAPNSVSAEHHSPANPQNAERLAESMRRLFHNVFIFGMNDEVVHTGFCPGCSLFVSTRLLSQTDGGR